MSKYTFEQIMESDIDLTKLNNRETMQYHYFNPLGACARKRAMDTTIDHYVEYGVIKSGWILAYGGLNTHYTDKVAKLAMQKRVSEFDSRYFVKALNEQIEKGYNQLANLILESIESMPPADDREHDKNGMHYKNALAVYELSRVENGETVETISFSSTFTLRGLQKRYEKRGHDVDFAFGGKFFVSNSCLYINWQENDCLPTGAYITVKCFADGITTASTIIEKTK